MQTMAKAKIVLHCLEVSCAVVWRRDKPRKGNAAGLDGLPGGLRHNHEKMPRPGTAAHQLHVMAVQARRAVGVRRRVYRGAVHGVVRSRTARAPVCHRNIRPYHKRAPCRRGSCSGLVDAATTPSTRAGHGRERGPTRRQVDVHRKQRAGWELHPEVESDY